MKTVNLFQAMNQEAKYLGLKVIGLIVAAVVGVVVWLAWNETAAIFACVVGYNCGSYISSLWHKGMLQRWIYGNLPVARLFGGGYLPPSHRNRFM